MKTGLMQGITRCHGPQIFASTLAILFAVTGSGALPGQHPEFTLQRAIETPGTLFESLPERQWITGTRSFSALDPDLRDRVVRHQVGTKKSTLLFTAPQIHAALRKAGTRAQGSRQMFLRGFRWHDAETIRVQLGDGVYRWRLGEPKAERILALPASASPLAVASDDRRAAYVRDHQLFVQVGTQARQITTDGSADVVYGGAAHRAEFGIRDGLWWSPDNRFLAFFREDLQPVTVYPYVDHTTMPPKALHGRYPMAGRANSAVKVGVYDTKSQRLVYLEQGREKDVYWTNVTFAPDGRDIFVAIVNRGQDHMRLVRFATSDGSMQSVLFEERDEQWIEPEHGPIFLDGKPGQFLWFSPRDGHRQLYLYGRDGKLIRQVTRGEFDIHDFQGFSPDSRHAFVHASGADPLQMHLWRVDLATAEMRQLTTERGWHSCQVRSDGAAVLDSYSNLTLPGRSAVINVATGATSDVVSIGHRFPVRGKQQFFTVAADDGTRLHGTLILPPELDETKKYPAILYVYGGPHSQLVKDRWLGGSSVWLHYMATRGFVICTLDNRGTDNRGIEFAQAVHRRLSELETRDQLRAVRHLRDLRFVDPKRIGVHGWSYGGYMTLNLMLRAPGTFACAIAGAPVTDWAQYETGYTERYMDTPKENPKGFRQASVLPLAKNLRGRLLVIHGTDDKTVMWSHSLAMVKRFIGSGQLVDYMPYPMQKHGIRGPSRHHLFKLLTRYFVDHLVLPK